MLDQLCHLLQAQTANIIVFFDILIIFVLPIAMIDRLTKIKSMIDFRRKLTLWSSLSLITSFAALYGGRSLNSGLDKFLHFSSLFNIFVVLAVIAIMHIGLLWLEKDDLKERS